MIPICKSLNTPPAYIDTILVVIVLYQTELYESKSYQSLSNELETYLSDFQQIDVVIVNNGPTPISCLTDKKSARLHLIEQLDNPGVSKAYNVAGRLAQELGKRWLLLLDQDTELPIGFLSRYVQSVEKYPNVPIHTPKLYDGSILVSPCGYKFYRGHLLTKIDPGKTAMAGRNVLNSGLLVYLDAFWKVGGYDESVDLYFSDFVFFDRLKKFYSDFAVVDVKLAHNLSSSDYSDRAKAVDRFYLYCKGAHAASTGNILKATLYVLTVGARSLLMNKRFRTLQFSKIFLNVWLQERAGK